MTTPTDKTETYSTPIAFPCEFAVKVIGHASDDFEQQVVDIIRHHFNDFDKDNLSCRPSKDNNYLAITATVHAENQAQLDALYQELTDMPKVIMAL